MASLRRQARRAPAIKKETTPAFEPELTFGQKMAKCRELVKIGQASDMKEAWKLLKNG